MSFVETKEFKLIYFDFLDYLAPHAVRTFTNSLAWQRRMFGWVPSEPSIVLLQDFADYGNATAAAAPHNRLIVEIEPISHAFETFPASERMYSLMNHEMVHVARATWHPRKTGAGAASSWARSSRRLQNPESLLYSYLTVPRYTAPRWYLEGGAVFMETWMGGRVGSRAGRL